ncbi:MAG: two-component system, OmpR family, sensor histidine kinase MprB [Solirubrobacteraceae bacterium]|nr:two-component system, OmpR family, sensor histidine kinase MprB [Solirubrobacteraceae bacterium]
MSFRRRIALAAAAAVAIAVVLGSLLTYLLTSSQLHSQVDSQLRNRAHTAGRLERFLQPGRKAPAIAKRDSERLGLDINRLDGKDADEAAAGAQQQGEAEAGTVSTRYGPLAKNLFGRLPPGPDQVRGYQQVVNAAGTIVVRSARGVSMPVDAPTLRLARHGGAPFFRDARVNGTHVRLLAQPFGKGRVIQLAQPLTEVDSLLDRLRLIFALLDLGGVALAALLGRVVAGAAVLPLKRLTQATEHVALTQDLSGRITSAGQDEIGRLASSFNAMLDALERSMSALDESVHAQRQLVADASHELRTPVTSLRTNVELLQRADDIDPHDRQRLLGDVVEQIEELTLLMNDLIELARGDEPFTEAEDVRLDMLVTDAVDRARRHAPDAEFELSLQPTLVAAVPARLERAVANLIDNAVKYSPPHEPVQVALAGGELTVRDHGPGISSEDLPHVFDRFYRGAEARGRPGSGLGLAIVRQVVEQQGGLVFAERAADHGTLMRVCLAGAETLSPDVLDERLHELELDARDRPDPNVALGASGRGERTGG